MAFNYSVQLYSVRTVLPQNPIDVLQQIKNMGYTGVEGYGDFNYPANEVKNVLSRIGLEIAGYHTPWANVQDDKLDHTIGYFKAIGNKFVIVPALPDECTNTIDAWKRTADKFNAISKRLQGEGLVLGYHNHASEFQLIDGQLPFTVFFDHTDPAIVMQMDYGNAMSGGADVMAMMRRYPNRAGTVHLKPYSKEGGFAPVIGKDDIDWPEFLSWCRDNRNTEHYIVEYEDDKAHPQLEGIELCIKGLKKLEDAGKI